MREDNSRADQPERPVLHSVKLLHVCHVSVCGADENDCSAGAGRIWKGIVQSNIRPPSQLLARNEVKGEVHPKMITSYLVVFGALSRMVKVRGAYDEPFWI